MRPVLLLCLALLLQGAADKAPDEARLAAGEVLVSLAPVPGGGPREAIGRGVIAAPPERVFRALTDYGHWDEFMPFLERSEARPAQGGAVEVLHVLDLPSPFGERRYRVRFTQRTEGGPGGAPLRIDRRIDWSLVPGSGNLVAHRGSWTLTAFGADRTLAVCRMRTVPGGGVPDWMMDRAAARNLPWIFDGLRQHVRRSRYDA